MLLLILIDKDYGVRGNALFFTYKSKGFGRGSFD
jgi:hypothetical protein